MDSAAVVNVKIKMNRAVRGDRLGPAGLGLAASTWLTSCKDRAAKVRVALFSTGDELVMPGDVMPADMKPGSIIINRFLRALLLRLGCV
jgi:molybdopterin molybdotransferase